MRLELNLVVYKVRICCVLLLFSVHVLRTEVRFLVTFILMLLMTVQ